MSTSGHPCFDISAKHSVSRLHLPVAPKCNVQCNFCNRKFDCVNESRPGVTSSVLDPENAADYTDFALRRLDNLGVVGIAGPGDPLANSEKVFETFSRIGELGKDLSLCLSTNGLGLPDAVDRILEAGVSHVTVTVNAVDPEIGAKIYSWVRWEGKTLRGIEAAERLLTNQEAGIRRLAEAGTTVKINMIAIPGINMDHLGEVAEGCASWGADIANIIPLIPVEGTKFASLESPDARKMLGVRSAVGQHLKLMLHCATCRADAAGLLGHDTNLLSTYREKQEVEIASEIHKDDEMMETVPEGSGLGGHMIKAAIASREGLLVNAHLGEIRSLSIYGKDEDGWKFLEKRETPPPGGGSQRWEILSSGIEDCKVIFVGGIGTVPRNILMENGIDVHEVEGTIESVLDEWSDTGTTSCHMKRTPFACGAACSGSGGGCG